MRYSLVSLAILSSTLNIATALPAPVPQGGLGEPIRVILPADIPAIPASRENLEARSPQGTIGAPIRVDLPASGPGEVTRENLAARSPQGTIGAPIRENLPADLPGFEVTREEIVERSAEPQGKFVGKPIRVTLPTGGLPVTRTTLPTGGEFPVTRTVIEARSAEAEPQGELGKIIRTNIAIPTGFSSVTREVINARSAEPQGQLGKVTRTNIAIPTGLPVTRENLNARSAEPQGKLGDITRTNIAIPTGFSSVTREVINARSAEPQGELGKVTRTNIAIPTGLPVTRENLNARSAEPQGKLGSITRSNIAIPSGFPPVTRSAIAARDAQGEIFPTRIEIPTDLPTPSSSEVTRTTIEARDLERRQGSIGVPVFPTVTVTITKDPITVTKLPPTETTTVTASPIRPTLTVPARRATQEDVAETRTVTLISIPTITVTASGYTRETKIPVLTVPSH